jgi:hypothetical protein
MSSALAHNRADDALESPRWEGLRWVLQRCATDAVPTLDNVGAEANAANYAALADAADSVARRGAELAWSPDTTRAVLARLSSSHDAFLDAAVAQKVQAYRAERLVLALDRLLASLPANQRPRPASDALDRLFQLSQSTPDFVSADFAAALEKFDQELKAK